MKTKIECFPIKMTEEEARKRAQKGIAGLYGKNKKINLRLMYLENRYLEFELTYHDNFIRKHLRKDKGKVDKQRIRAIVDATTCNGAYVDDPIKTIWREVDDLDIQPTYYTDERLIHSGQEAVRRMAQRHVGRTTTAEVKLMRKVYRPYWIAIYGEMIEGTKARYLPIPADGNMVSRSI